MQYDNQNYLLASTYAKKYFNIRNLKPYQILVIVNILENSKINGNFKGKSQLIVLPTGAGKSLCFQIPAIILNDITIIVYPLLALLRDQENSFKKAKIAFVCLKGGQTKKQRSQIFFKLATGKVHILITNPETLTQQKIFKFLCTLKIELVVIDEAHVIAQWGQSFRPAYLKLCKMLPLLKPNQCLAFTATADKSTTSFLTKTLFQGKYPKIIRGNANRENIYYNSIYSLSKNHTLLEILKVCSKPALVFCPTRAYAEHHYMLLKRINRTNPVLFYHARLTSKEKNYIQDWFLKSQDGILFSTNAFGLGVNKKNIRTVIHVRLPYCPEEFLQESGRGGRDGKTTNSIVLVSFEDYKTYYQTNNKARKALLEVFLDSSSCRRMRLMKLIDQNLETCTGCDICLHNFDPNIPDLKLILNFFALNSFCYNSENAALLLCGIKNIMVSSKEDEKSLYFGYLSNWNFEDLKIAILKLIKFKILKTISLSHKKNLIFYYPPINRRKNILDYKAVKEISLWNLWRNSQKRNWKKLRKKFMVTQKPLQR